MASASVKKSISIEALPDELLLRIFAVIEPAKSSWLDPPAKSSWLNPTHARADTHGEEEFESAASLARIGRVSRRWSRLIDSFEWVVIDGVASAPFLRQRPAKRLAVQIYDKTQLQGSACSNAWLREHVEAATVVLHFPFQSDFPSKVYPFPCPELYGFALRELNLLGGEISCIEGSWLEPFLQEMPSLETLRLSHVDRPVMDSQRNLSLTTLQTGCYYSGDVLFLQSLVSGTQRLRDLHLTDIPRRLHDRAFPGMMAAHDEWRTNMGWVLDGVIPNLRSLTYLGYEPFQDDAESRALSHLLPGAVSLERLVTGLHGFTNAMLELLIESPQLQYLRLVRSAHTPATDIPEHLWTFEELTDQIAALLALPERPTGLPLLIEVEVQGSLVS
ncbi:hypothetical protein JCM10908_006022 [Rhodotorula pacifica]|uniref:F-box protein n=1 Tax=Rhodotorula pacifica TaxID=1495444 RepID=UPI0031783B77